jgi:hypothetical protein
VIRKHVGIYFNVCLLDFYVTQILTSTTVIIECISWLIKVTDNNDSRWKPEIENGNKHPRSIKCGEFLD